MFSRKKVFISYSHQDKEFAYKIKEELENRKFRVFIDEREWEIDDNITELVDRMITSSDLTLAIISKNSLRSKWVIKEAMDTFAIERVEHKKKYVAGFIDEEFRDPRFYNEVVEQIDKEIDQLDGNIKMRREQRLPIKDFVNKHTLLLDQRNNLGILLNRLNNLSLDFRGGAIEESLNKFERNYRPVYTKPSFVLSSVFVLLLTGFFAVFFYLNLNNSPSMQSISQPQDSGSPLGEDSSSVPSVLVDTSSTLEDLGEDEYEPSIESGNASSVGQRHENASPDKDQINEVEPDLPLEKIEHGNHLFSCSIMTRPRTHCDGVKVYVNDIHKFTIGRQREYILLPNGTHSIRAEKEGYGVFNDIITVNNRDPGHTQISLNVLQ